MPWSREPIVTKIRFGERHHAYEDDFEGEADIVTRQNAECTIIGLMMRDDRKFTRVARNWVLDACVFEGYERAFAKIKGTLWRYDLTQRPYRRARV